MSPNKILVGHGPPDDCQPVIVSGQIAFEAREKTIQHRHFCTYTKKTGNCAGAYESSTAGYEHPPAYENVRDAFLSIPCWECRFSLCHCDLRSFGGAG